MKDEFDIFATPDMTVYDVEKKLGDSMPVDVTTTSQLCSLLNCGVNTSAIRGAMPAPWRLHVLAHNVHNPDRYGRNNVYALTREDGRVVAILLKQLGYLNDVLWRSRDEADDTRMYLRNHYAPKSPTDLTILPFEFTYETL